MLEAACQKVWQPVTQWQSKRTPQLFRWDEAGPGNLNENSSMCICESTRS